MTQPLPLRLRIQKAMAAAIETITPGNGYVNDMSGAVFRGRSLFGQGDPETLVSILEPPVPPDQMESPETSTIYAGGYDLIVQGFVPDDPDNPTDPAHIAMAEVKKALGLERKKRSRILVDGNDTFSILTENNVSSVTKLNIGGGVVRPPDGEISDFAYFTVLIRLEIVEDMEDPFA